MRISTWLRPLIVRLSRPRPRRLAQRPAFRPCLEALEDRLTPSGGGLLDPTFGSGGIVNLPATTDHSAQAVAVQPDGKVLIAGYYSTSKGNFAGSVQRLNTDGTLDTTFNGTGSVNLPGTAGPTALAIQPDGKILIGSDTSVKKGKTSITESLVARLNTNGTFDTTFGSNGLWVAAFPSGQVMDLAILTDPAHPGTVTGIVGAVEGGNFEAIKLTPAGVTDKTFGSGGVAVIATPNGYSNSSSQSLAVDPLSGEIYLAGEVREVAGDSAGALAALTPTGVLDKTFGGGAGYVLSDFTNFTDVAVQHTVSANGQPVSRILVAGGSNIAPVVGLVEGYTLSGALDTTFGNGGSFTLAGVAGGTAPGFNSLAVEADGSIVVGGGQGSSAGNGEMLVGHLTASGAADTSFGPDGTGFTVVQDDGAQLLLRRLAIDPINGDILAGGDSYIPGNETAEIIRLTAP